MTLTSAAYVMVLSEFETTVISIFHAYASNSVVPIYLLTNDSVFTQSGRMLLMTSINFEYEREGIFIICLFQKYLSIC